MILHSATTDRGEQWPLDNWILMQQYLQDAVRLAPLNNLDVHEHDYMNTQTANLGSYDYLRVYLDPY